MQHLRIGSTVNAGYQQPNGSGGYNVAYATGEVTNITDAHLEVQPNSGPASVLPWSALFNVSVTTD